VKKYNKNYCWILYLE